MTEYRFHWWPTRPAGTPSVTLEAQSKLQGAALALQRFVQLGCHVDAPLAHLDVTDADGAKHTVLVEEVLDWLQAPEQATFVRRERLGALIGGGPT